MKITIDLRLVPLAKPGYHDNASGQNPLVKAEVPVQLVGSIESIWRYPVKSMAGETVTEAFVGFSGVYGDRCYAFRSSAARRGFPYLNAVAQQQMLRFRPHFPNAERAAKPPNLEAAKSISPGVNPVDAAPGDLLLDVETPAGDVIEGMTSRGDPVEVLG